jgi:hypothetical protein
MRTETCCEVVTNNINKTYSCDRWCIVLSYSYTVVEAQQSDYSNSRGEQGAHDESLQHSNHQFDSRSCHSLYIPWGFNKQDEAQIVDFSAYNWFLMVPSIATKFQYVNSLFFIGGPRVKVPI